MGSRYFAWLLIILLVMLGVQIMYGRGGRSDVAQSRARLAAQKQVNDRMEQENRFLAAEIAGWDSGTEVLEEKARMGFGMTKPDEVFVRVAQ
ncbi:septum formation initiator family protein [Candidatus Symbiobacter mobilis]|uniref:Cell division protein FtsB n=1 Tax=Candidatus Symbiobacter mobilis CR TaxID=946483 RepID=U5N571_9BURK|nr:septum formation initiator family protein [Candidatus Symbiobacter mobilis]AGX86400.1 cell division protein FtsB [Candidatus Symbiobacter mobilis CR]